MAYKIDDTASYGRLREYVAQVIGGLGARAELRSELPTWQAFRDRIVGLRAGREAARDAVLAAWAVVRVADAEWDPALVAVSSRSYELAKKNASEEPYVTLFAKLPAKRATSLGPAKAGEVGDRVVKDGRRLEPERLGAELDRLAAANTAILSAKAGVDAAEDALFVPRQAKKRCIRDLNELIAVTEARILMAFPGNDALVRAILQPWFQRKSPGKAGDDAPEPEAPDVDDDAEEEEDDDRET